MKRSAATITVCSLAESNRGYVYDIRALRSILDGFGESTFSLRGHGGGWGVASCPASVVGSSVPGASPGFRTSMEMEI